MCLFTADPPVFIHASNNDMKVAEGETVVLTCRAVGAPTPHITWSRGNTKELFDERYVQHDSGDLEIKVRGQSNTCIFDLTSSILDNTYNYYKRLHLNNLDD